MPIVTEISRIIWVPVTLPVTSAVEAACCEAVHVCIDQTLAGSFEWPSWQGNFLFYVKFAAQVNSTICLLGCIRAIPVCVCPVPF